MPKKKKDPHYYPFEICHDCGVKYGKVYPGHLATYYPGVCGWCKQQKIVTQPRDYGYPKSLEGSGKDKK